MSNEQPALGGIEGIEKRRAQFGPARNTAEQLCYEAIEDAIMDVIAANRDGDQVRGQVDAARAEAYLNAISTYRRCAGKGHPFSSAPARTENASR